MVKKYLIFYQQSVKEILRISSNIDDFILRKKGLTLHRLVCQVDENRDKTQF